MQWRIYGYFSASATLFTVHLFIAVQILTLIPAINSSCWKHPNILKGQIKAVVARLKNMVLLYHWEVRMPHHPDADRVFRFVPLARQVDNLTIELQETRALAEELHSALRAEQAAKTTLQVRPRRRV